MEEILLANYSGSQVGEIFEKRYYMTKKHIEVEWIQERIYLIRGHRVILSHDLAQLYGVESRILIQAVKRNLERFPDDFMFKLENQEVTNLRSQIVISSWGGSRWVPFAFTEQGIAMLSSVLRSPEAIQVNIEIMRAFVGFKKLSQSMKAVHDRIFQLESRYDRQFKSVFDAIREIINPPIVKKRKIGFQSDEED